MSLGLLCVTHAKKFCLACSLDWPFWYPTRVRAISWGSASCHGGRMRGSTHSVSGGVFFASLWKHVSYGIFHLARCLSGYCRSSLWSLVAALLTLASRVISIRGIPASHCSAAQGVIL